MSVPNRAGAQAPGAAPPAGAGGLGHIGRYELVARLGAGGMGEIYLARASGAGGFEKELVIKRILPHLASDPGFVLRFIEEGKLVVKLRHAGIAQVLDMGEDGGVYFIAMEHVDGKDLGELLKVAAAAGMKMPRPLVVHVLLSVLDALDYAHEARDGEGRPLGIIHRDVSPSNVMISKSGEVKLLDFGIARAAERLQSSTTGAIRGKYSYMSPQQAAGLELDARSDLFSLGVIAWELLAGARPFDGASDLLTLDRIRFFDPGPLEAAAPGVPAALSALVGRLLAKAPEDRFPSAHEAAQALRAYIVEAGVLASTRQLAGWYAEVVATLPAPLRDRPTQGLSLDELLRLGLSGPGSRPGTHTVGPEPRPVTAPNGASGPSGEPRPGTAPAAGPTGEPRPVTAPAGGAAGAVEHTATGPEADGRVEVRRAGAAGGRGRRMRPGLVALLVGLNVALIALVLVLVLRDSGDGPGPLAGAEDALLARAGQGGETASGELGADAAGPDEAGAEDAEGTRDARVEAQADNGGVSGAGDVAEAQAGEVDAGDVVAAEIVAGSGFGRALAALDEEVFAGEVEVVIRSQPPGATLLVAGLGHGPAPRVVRARRGVVLSGRATLADHQPRTFEVIVGDEEVVTIALRSVAKGLVTFRFFPAEGTQVEIDGRPLTVGSNVVSTELTAGAHQLVLVGRAGERIARGFEVVEGQTTNLGTLDLRSQ